jgi:hypothetical protein
MKITRDVIIDLWPVYIAGEASPDTRALVDEFLQGDHELAEELRRPAAIEQERPTIVAPDVEAEALVRTRRRLHGYRPLLMLAMVFSCLAFGRIVADTSWDVSPRNFIATAAVAAVFWIAFFVALWRMRAEILIRTKGSQE